jgi:hypothetical protein
MKVGILTFHAAHNYGAMLQAYATGQAVQRLGHEARIIDLLPESMIRRNRPFVCPDNIRQAAKMSRKMLHFNAWQRRYVRYEEFKQRYMNLTERFFSAEQLRKDPPGFDAYIAGSDQIWNPERGIDPIWLLDFVRDARRIAYAASFGTDAVNEKYHSVFREFLRKFSALSCRESRGVEMIREMTGLEAAQVLDPTLLLSAQDWESVCVPPQNATPYLLVYCLEESPEFMQLVPRMAEKSGLPVWVISTSVSNRFRCADKVIRDAGPREFLGLFCHASLICTNSFHGTAFSINFRKNFVSIPHTTRNSRLASLLQLLSLEQRQLRRAADLDCWSRNDLHMDYTTAGKRLQNEVNRSIAFLKEALSAK